MYSVYCKNRTQSEALINECTESQAFFKRIQMNLAHQLSLDSYLLKPVQRITKYQLLLRDLKKSGEKAGMETGNLEKALQLMQDIPKRANDAMALSMIYGYEGNIHANGQIILQVSDQYSTYLPPHCVCGVCV